MTVDDHNGVMRSPDVKPGSDRVQCRICIDRAGPGYARRLLHSVFSVCLCLIASVQLSVADNTATRVYSVGIVPQFNARHLFDVWLPIVDAIERKTGYRLELLGSPGIPQFEKALREGWYDFAYLNPYHLISVAEAQGYQPMLRDGSRQLKGILVVAKNGRINRLADLQNKVIAFPAPNALGASLLLRAELRNRHRLDFEARYVQSHSSVYLHVAAGLVDAGGGVRVTLEEEDARVRDKLTVLHETRPVPPHPLAVHPRVPQAVSAAVRQAILEMAAEPETLQLLERVPMSRPVSATLEEYKILKSLGLESLND